MTISPAALRGPPGGGDEGAESSAHGDDAAAHAGGAEGGGFRSAAEAMLLARGLASALAADPARAARVHDLVSPARALGLLRA